MRPRRLVGVDISDRSIEVVEVENRRTIAVRSIGRVTLPDGVIERGEIKLDGALNQALKEAFRSAVPHPPQVKQAVCNLPEEQIYLRRIAIKSGSADELRAQGSKAIREFVPFPPEKIVWDALPVAGAGGFSQALIVAIPRRVFDLYCTAIKAGELELYGFAFDSLALARVFFGGHSDPPALVIDLGGKTSVISIVDDLGVHSSMNVASGGDTMTKSLAKKFEVEEKAAEELKRRHGFDPEAEHGKIFLVLQKTLQPILDSAADLIEEYRSETGNSPGQIMLSGGTSFLYGIDEYIGSALDLPASRGKIISGADLSLLPEKAREAFEAVPGLFAVAMGLTSQGFTDEGPLFSSGGKEVALAPPKYYAVTEAEKPAISIVAPVKKAVKAVKGISRGLTIGILIIWLVGMAGGVYYYLERSSQATNKRKAVTPASQAGVEERSYTAEVTVRFSGNTAENEVAGQLDTIEKEGERVIPLSDLKEGTKSQGTVNIKSSLSANQRLVAGTRIMSPEGKIFRLVSAIVVPANSEIKDVAVIADEPGAQGDLAPTEFTIPGLAADSRFKVSVKSENPFVGGGKSGTISEVAINDAVSALTDELRTTAGQELSGRLPPDTVSTRQIATEQILESTIPKPGVVPESQAKVKLKMKFLMPFIAEADLMIAGRTALAKELGAKEAAAYGFSGWQISQKSFDAGNQVGVFIITVTIRKE